MFGLWDITIIFQGKKQFHFRMMWFGNSNVFVFRKVQSLEFFFYSLTYGALQTKLGDGGSVCKGLEDIVGSVRGFLRANL